MTTEMNLNWFGLDKVLIFLGLAAADVGLALPLVWMPENGGPN
jgi:hypothetical protein